MSSELDPLLSALANLVVARGLPFPELAERLKGHCVAAATARIDGKVTDSKLSVLTGLQRRDVARLRAFDTKPARDTPQTQLVTLWRTHPDYAPGGEPSVLERSGPSPSFDSLARLVRQDVHPRTLLDALAAAGTVALEGDCVRLIQNAYLPLGGSEDQLAYLAENVGDHLRAATANVEGAAFFERALHYAGLTEDQFEVLHSKFSTEVMALLESLRDEAESMKSKNPEGATHRMRLGAYAIGTREHS